MWLSGEEQLPSIDKAPDVTSSIACPQKKAYAGKGDYQLPYWNSWGVGGRKSCPENMSVKG